MMRYWFLIVILMLAACQTSKSSLNNAVDDLIIKGGETFNIMNAYAVIQHDFKKGRIMQARLRVLAMRRSDHDYKRAQQFLKQKIEPARRRVFVHYLKMANKRERNKLWSQAMWAYDQAMAVTLKPKAMQKKRDRMARNVRQLRLKTLIKQRRKEDQMIFNYAIAYESPPGLSPKDDIYGHMRERYEDMLEDRARQAFHDAMRFLRKGQPEISYIEIESYLRLQPDSIKGKKLMQSIQRKMPSFLKIPPASVNTLTPKFIAAKRVRHLQVVTAKQVRSALKAGEWLKAKQLAHIYRRNGGKGAAKLLAQTQQRVKIEAASLFSKGSVAFRKEKLDRAIHYWKEAVAMAPEESEYVESLRRARQLQERLMLLQESN